MNLLEIDGGFGEGGGQLSRYAVALAAVTGRAIHLHGIRARRAKPGLMAQHLAALGSVAKISGGVLEGAFLGAREIWFRPGPIRGGDHRFEVGTAGSVSLVLQALLPVALHADGPSRLTITGGTDVRMAPPLDYLRLVFLPWLARMGVEVRVELVRRGYYPRGGGELRVAVAPRAEPEALRVEAAGALRRVRGVAHVANLPEHVATRMSSAAREALAGVSPLQLQSEVLSSDAATGTGGALVLVAETEHTLLGAATVAERGVRAETLGRDAGRALRAELESGAGLDEHAADQLLIYAAQAREPSVFTLRELSEHARTAMWLIAQFLPVRFEVEPLGKLQRVRVARAG